MNQKGKIIFILLAGILIGIVLSKQFLTSKHPMSDMHTSKQTNHKKGKKIKYWVAPMDPGYRRNKPGKSPMGMDLVPVYETDSENEGSIRISPTVINNIGVAATPVVYEPLSREIDTVGYVVVNEDNIEHVNSYVDGWVRGLRVTAVGDPIEKGQILFKLYSPSLVNAQQEYLLALKSNNTRLIRANHKKLRTLGLTDAQIRALNKTRKVKQEIDIYANTSGIVSKLNIRDGMYVDPDKELMVIEDLSSVWVRVEVYEKQADWVHTGQVAVASFPGLPGMLWQGEVIYIYPTLDKKTHTLGVRLQFPNPDLTLKPNMYASVRIFIPTKKKSIVVPKSAVIRTEHGAHVILALGKGRFKPQKVTTGIEFNGKTAILKGLNTNDRVVTSGQFLIDSESNLKGGFKRLASSKDKTSMQDTSGKHTTKLHMGTILAIDYKAHKLTLRHVPIEHLNMPEMVMKLPVESSIDLSDFKVNQDIHFQLKEKRANHFIIIKIKPKEQSKKTGTL